MARPNNPMDPDLLKKIRELLSELRLPEMIEQLERELESGPDDDDTRLSLLWRLLDVQLRARRERAVERRLRDARFPAHKTLDGFHFPFQPNLRRERVLELGTLDFVRQGQNVLIAGMSGTGKSHICIALGHLACLAGFRTLYTTSAGMLGTLHASLATHTLNAAIKPYLRTQLLIIDEVGLDRPERDRSRDAHLFYKVISTRYERQRSTIITSNIAWDTWGEYLGDDVATVAILDRLVHHGYRLNINGPSYRAAEHEKLNSDDGDEDDDRAGD